MNTGMEQLYII